MSICKRSLIPCSITAAALFVGFSSMIAAASGNYMMAAQLILLSLFLDGIDGALARLLKASSTIGAELDTFVDMTSFGLAPAFLMYQVALKELGLVGLGMAFAIVLSGGYRLSRFRAVDPYRGQHGYLGLPITVAAATMACFVIAVEKAKWNESWFGFTHGPVAVIFWAAVVVMLYLQVSHVHYGKMTKQPLVFIPFALALMSIFSQGPMVLPGAFGLLATALIYAFISPLFSKHHVIVDETEEEPVVTSGQ